MPTYPENLSFKPYSPSLSFDYIPANIGGQEMDPLLLGALIKGGTSLLGGLLGGAEKKKDRKYREKRSAEMLRLLKPKQSYYQTPYLKEYDKVLSTAVMANMQKRLGEMLGGTGLDLQGIISKMTTPQAQPRAQGRFPGEDFLRQRYDKRLMR